MSQRRSLKKGVRPEITIVSAQPMSASGGQEVTYFNQKITDSPKVRSIDHHQSLVLGVDLPHPPRSAPPPRPADPSRGPSSKADKSPKIAPPKPSPPLLQSKGSPSQSGTSPSPGRIPVTRPAPPKPSRPKRTQSLGKASDSRNQAIGVPRHPSGSHTTDNLDDRPPSASIPQEGMKIKPPRPKSEVIHHSWASASVGIDLDDLKQRPSIEPSTSPITDESGLLDSVVKEESTLSNGVVNGSEDEGIRAITTEPDEAPVGGSSLGGSSLVNPPKKPARPTIITAAGKSPARQQEEGREITSGPDERPALLNSEQSAESPVVNTPIEEEASAASVSTATVTGAEHISADTETVKISKPVKPAPPFKSMPAGKKVKPIVPVKPSFKPGNIPVQTVAAATSNGYSLPDDLGAFESVKAESACSSELIKNTNSSRRRITDEQQQSALEGAVTSVIKSQTTRTPPSRPAQAPSTSRSGTIKKGASFDQHSSHDTPSSQLPYSSHPERGMRNRSQTAPKIPVKPRRTKSLHRRPSISPPSTPPPPPREEVQMILSGSLPPSSVDPATLEAALVGELKTSRPVPPQRVSSIDSYDNKMSSTVRRGSLQGASVLSGIRESEQEELKRKPVRPAPPKPVRSFTISTSKVKRDDPQNLKAADTPNATLESKPLKRGVSVDSTYPPKDKSMTSHSPTNPVSPSGAGNEWDVEAKFTGPILSPGTKKDVFWSEDTIGESGRISGQLNLPGGARIRDPSGGSEDVGQASPPLLQQTGASPVCTPTRPAPPKPSFPPNKKLTQDGHAPATVGESSHELQTDGHGVLHEVKVGSSRNPHRPAPPRPPNLSRQKNVNMGDSIANEPSKETSLAQATGNIRRSQSVKSPTRPAPPVHPVRRSSGEVSPGQIDHQSIAENKPKLVKAAPPARPSVLPVKKEHDIGTEARDVGGEGEDNRERTNSWLMDKIYRNMEVTGPHAVALFDYRTSDSADLEFQAGDVILLESRINNEWLRGSLEGVSGIFPSTFVEIIIDLDGDSAALGIQKQGDTSGTSTPFDLNKPHAVALQAYLACDDGELSFDAGETIELIDRDGDFFVGFRQGISGRFPASFVAVLRPLPVSDSNLVSENETTGSSVKEGPSCQAMFTFHGESADDLAFKEGDVIKLLQKISDEWYEGELNGKTGMFPSGFVDILVDLPKADNQEEVDPDSLPNALIDGLDPQAKALYDFQAMDKGELSFKVGELIKLRKKLEDDWYEGEADGKVGIFPAGFVEVLTPLPIE